MVVATPIAARRATGSSFQRPNVRWNAAAANLIPVWPERSRQILRRRLAGVIVPGCVDHGYAAILRRAASKRDGASSEPVHLFEDRGAHTPPTPRVPPF